MKVIIPIAGLGTRLHPHSKKRQKCLLPVAGKPVIDHIIEPIIKQGFDHIVLITGHLEEQVKDYVQKYISGSNGKIKISFILQKDALGLGHAVFQGLEETNEPVLIQLGDVIYNCDFKNFCNTPNHVIAIDKVPDPERFGIVEVDGDKIIKFYEKPENPPTNLGIVGLYYLTNQKILYKAIRYLVDNNINTRGEIQLTDAFQLMVDWGEPIIAKSVPKWYDCGIPDSFLASNRMLLKSHNYKSNGSTINEPVYVGENCTIKNSSIGPYVTIMDGGTIINSEVSDAIILWNAYIKDKKIKHKIVREGPD